MPAQNAPHNPLIQLSAIGLTYRALPVLRDIHFTITPGQQWAFLGPNGSGKTSLAQIICANIVHFSGTMTRSKVLQAQGTAYVCFETQKALCEQDKRRDDSEFRADANDPGTSIRQLITGGGEEDRDFNNWVQRLNLGAVLDRGLRFVSTGEMRKALLIQAILNRPALLVLDNPMDGLDRQTQAEMRTVLDELLHSSQSVLLLCRQQEDIPDAISHVAVLDQGRIVASGERQSTVNREDVQQLMNPPVAPLQQLPPPSPRHYELSATEPLITMRNVSVSYDGNCVLQNVNWRFERGQHCQISGPNGCGKSTLLSLITGDNHKAYGQDITLFGIRRGSGESVWDIKQKYGQLDNSLHLNWVRGMRVLEVVISGFFDTNGLYDNWSDTQRDTAQGWLAALGLADYARARFDDLSFGLQRMVLLARAMVKSPAILLLDEPSLGLDGHHRQQLLKAIDHIARHSDTQILFVSHSKGDTPACINQHLYFTPHASGFELYSSTSAP